MTRVLATAVALIALGAATAWAQPRADRLPIRGELTYLARIALPPDSVAVVEIRDAAAPADASVVAEQRIALGGRQVPVPFELGVDRATLVPGARYVVRGGIVAGGRPIWAGEPQPLDIAAEAVELGTVVMQQVRAQGFASSLRCGDLTVTVGFIDDMARLRAGDAEFDLKPERSASGALYSAGTEPPTTFWSKGERATLMLHGVEYPECLPEPALEQVFRAGGNEPGWSLVVDDAGLELTTGYGEQRLRAASFTVEAKDRRRVYRADADGQALAVTVIDRICTDTMSEMQRPMTVEALVGGDKLSGCSGEAAALLVGAEWSVESIDEQSVVAGSAPSLSFDAEGSVYGKASCNRYRGAYELTGEGLTMGPFATTTMACPEPLMEQEQRFLELLAKVQRFEVTSDGGLELRTAERKVLAARKAG